MQFSDKNGTAVFDVSRHQAWQIMGKHNFSYIPQKNLWHVFEVKYIIKY